MTDIDNTTPKGIPMRTALIILSIIGGVILLSGLGIYAKFNSINNKSVDLQTQLTAQYLDNQNYLSTFISGFYEQLGVADRKSEQLDAILTDAVKGRYEGGSTAAPVGGQFISAMIEAYPDLSGLDSYDKIIDYVSAGREGYRQQQSKLLDMLRSFDRWRNTGLINKQLIRIMGVPGSDLRAQIGEDVVTGQAALDRMYLIVLASDAREAYETGELEPLAVPDEGGATADQEPAA